MLDSRRNSEAYSVSQLSTEIRQFLEKEFSYIRLTGEVSGYKGASSNGHIYFSLKDSNATINAIIWKYKANQIGLQLQDGLEVVVTGKVTAYAGSSRYQIIIDSVELAGHGSLMALLEATKNKLKSEGLFDLARKKPLPYLPRVIGLITSPTGAVRRDIEHRLDDRFPCHVLLYPVTVQGPSCAPEVIAAIKAFHTLLPGGAIPRPDLLIIARGGGSLEDLWGFNDEALVRAVAASKIPIISAIGHETDTSLVDYAADKRAPTPSAAAEMAVPVRKELEEKLNSLARRYNQSIRNYIDRHGQRVDDLSCSLPRWLQIVQQKKVNFSIFAQNYNRHYRYLLEEKRSSLKNMVSRFTPIILHQYLQRKYSTYDKAAQDLFSHYRHYLLQQTMRYQNLYQYLNHKTLEVKLHRARDKFKFTLTQLQYRSSYYLEQKRGAYNLAVQMLDSLSYQRVLERGFLIAVDKNGRYIKTAKHAFQEDSFLLNFSDGNLKVKPVEGERP